MKFLRNLFKKPYKIKYCRIRKTKKDEIVIFKMPPDTTPEQLTQFKIMFESAIKKDGPYMLLTSEVGIIKAKKNQIKRSKWYLILKDYGLIN